MSATNQSPLAFPARFRASAPQPGSQIRPENHLPVSSEDTSKGDPIAAIKKAIRDTVDLLYSIRNLWTPTALYISGDQTGASIVVPTQASLSDLGTGIGLQVQLTRPGFWIIACSVSLEAISDTGEVFFLNLAVNNSPMALRGVVVPPGDGITSIVQFWQVTSITGDETCVLKIAKGGGGGTSQVIPPTSTLMATWQGGAQTT